MIGVLFNAAIKPIVAQSDRALQEASENAAFLKCGTKQPDEKTALLIEDANSRFKANRLAQGGPPERTGTVNVPVHVHIITSNSGAGDVPDQQVADQIAVLNNSYSGVTGGRTPFTDSPSPALTASQRIMVYRNSGHHS